MRYGMIDMLKKRYFLCTIAGRAKVCAAILLLTACAQPVPVISAPPPEWMEPVPEPEVPAETTDESVAGYLVELLDALKKSNNKLARLRDWANGLND